MILGKETFLTEKLFKKFQAQLKSVIVDGINKVYSWGNGKTKYYLVMTNAEFNKWLTDNKETLDDGSIDNETKVDTLENMAKFWAGHFDKYGEEGATHKNLSFTSDAKKIFFGSDSCTVAMYDSIFFKTGIYLSSKLGKPNFSENSDEFGRVIRAMSGTYAPVKDDCCIVMSSMEYKRCLAGDAPGKYINLSDLFSTKATGIVEYSFVEK